jgi:hypothetical protein
MTSHRPSGRRRLCSRLSPSSARQPIDWLSFHRFARKRTCEGFMSGTCCGANALLSCPQCLESGDYVAPALFSRIRN